jgi:hypothetical protein
MFVLWVASATSRMSAQSFVSNSSKPSSRFQLAAIQPWAKVRSGPGGIVPSDEESRGDSPRGLTNVAKHEKCGSEEEITRTESWAKRGIRVKRDLSIKEHFKMKTGKASQV